MKQKPLQILEDMLDAADKIFIYTYEMSFQDFMNNDQAMDAVLRNFEIIGEAANKLSDSIRSYDNKIEWKKIVDFRNCIIHGYFQIDYELVWKIKEEELPALAESIDNLIKTLYAQSD